MEETEFRGRHSRLKQHHLSKSPPTQLPCLLSHEAPPPTTTPSTQCANTLLAFQLWLMLFLSFERPSESLSAHRQTRLPIRHHRPAMVSLFWTPIQPGLSFLSDLPAHLSQIRHATNSGSLSSCLAPFLLPASPESFRRGSLHQHSALLSNCSVSTNHRLLEGP